MTKYKLNIFQTSNRWNEEKKKLNKENGQEIPYRLLRSGLRTLDVNVCRSSVSATKMAASAASKTTLQTSGGSVTILFSQFAIPKYISRDI
jgi:hypothetical protein